MAGLLVPDARLEFWPEESTTTQAGLFVGPAQPTDATTQLALTASGDPTSLDTLYIQTAREGLPTGDDAGFHWRNDPSEDWRGHDAPNTIERLDVLHYAAIATQGYRHPSLLSLDDGTLLMAAVDADLVTGERRVITKVRPADGILSGPWQEVLSYTVPDTSGLANGQLMYMAHPQLVRGQAGRIELYAVTYAISDPTDPASAATVQVRKWEYVDGSWVDRSLNCLEPGLRTFGSDLVPEGAYVRKLSVAYGGGQYLLLLSMGVAFGGAQAERCVQYSSKSVGATFKQIGNVEFPLADQVRLARRTGYAVAGYHNGQFVVVARPPTDIGLLEDGAGTTYFYDITQTPVDYTASIGQTAAAGDVIRVVDDYFLAITNNPDMDVFTTSNTVYFLPIPDYLNRVATHGPCVVRLGDADFPVQDWQPLLHRSFAEDYADPMDVHYAVVSDGADLYALFTSHLSDEGAAYVLRSSDSGATWEARVRGSASATAAATPSNASAEHVPGRWFITAHNPVTAPKLDRPTFIEAVAHAGAVYVAGNFTLSARPGTLTLMQLGGYTNIPRPWSYTSAANFFQAEYNVHVLGLMDPTAQGWAESHTGAVTSAPTFTGQAWRVQVLGTDALWTLGGPGLAPNHAEVAYGKVIAQVTAGTLGASIEAHSGGNYAAVELRLTSTNVILADALTDAVIATVAHGIGGMVECLYGVDATTGTCSVAFREHTTVGGLASEDRNYTVQTFSLSTSIGLPAIGWSEGRIRVSTGGDVLWRLLSFQGAPRNYFDGGVVVGQPYEAYNVALASPGITEAPTDITRRPRHYYSKPRYVGRGISFKARGGPTVLGESFTIEPEFQFGGERALPTVSPTPRHPFLTEDVRASGSFTPSTVAYRFNNRGADAEVGSEVLAFYLDGMRGGDVTVEVRRGGSWAAAGTISSAVVAGGGHQLRDSVLVPNPAGTQLNSRYIETNELAGGLAVFGSTRIAIVGNAAGVWGGQGKPVRVYLDETGLTGAEAATGLAELTLYAPRAVGLLHMRGLTDIEGVRLTLATEPATNESRQQLRVAAIGAVEIWGRRPSETRSRVRRQNEEILTNRDGTRWTLRQQPDRRQIRLSWSADGIPAVAQQSPAEGFEYLIGSAAPAAGPYATRYVTITDWPELLGRLGRQPLVYLPRIEVDDGLGDQLKSYPGWSAEALYGRIITDQIGVDTVQGPPGQCEIVRGNQLTIEEEQ